MKTGDAVRVRLDNEEHEFVLIAGTAKTGELNLKAPLAILLNIMSPGDTVSRWISREGTQVIRVELIEHKKQEVVK